ncbi:MAG: CPBP family intramembrane metalloprotease [Lentimicrobium sp.]|nr:CPBP family intramembrane metalloprotease [Lentimicrobium sp.]
MVKEPVFSKISPGGQVLLLIALVLAGTIFSIVAAYGISMLVWGKEFVTQAASGQIISLGFLRTFQIINQIGIFIFPPIAFAWLISEGPLNFLGISKPRAGQMILAIIAVLSIAPVINVLVQWNEGLTLPHMFRGIENWMRNTEENAARLTENFLNAGNPADLALNLLMIGILPALGEELLFRPAFIGVLKKMFRNVHWPVMISAIVFSAFHLQFFGFFPRLVLGILMGYLYVWSGSLWVPALAHFVNNSVVVVVSWLFQNQYIKKNLTDLEGAGSWPYVAISVVLTALVMTGVYISGKRGRDMETNPEINQTM